MNLDSTYYTWKIYMLYEEPILRRSFKALRLYIVHHIQAKY